MKDCDLTQGEYDYELHFTDDKQMEEYMKIRFDNRIKKNKEEAKKRRQALKRKK